MLTDNTKPTGWDPDSYDFQVQAMSALFEGGQEPTHPEFEPAVEFESGMVPESCRLHHGEIRHVHVRFGHGWRIQIRRHRSQRSLAENRWILET